MIEIQPLLSKEKKAPKAATIKLDAHLTGLRITMAANPKAQSLSEQIEKGGTDITIPSPSLSGAMTIVGPKNHGVMEGYLATAQLPIYRIGFSVSIKGRDIEEKLRDLRALLHPASSSKEFVDPITSPVAVFVTFPKQARRMVSAGILIDLQQNFIQEGRGKGIVLEGEVSIMDCRLDTEFLRAIQLEHLQ